MKLLYNLYDSFNFPRQREYTPLCTFTTPAKVFGFFVVAWFVINQEVLEWNFTCPFFKACSGFEQFFWNFERKYDCSENMLKIRQYWIVYLMSYIILFSTSKFYANYNNDIGTELSFLFNHYTLGLRKHWVAW